jgi:hypothetical protein
MAVLVLRATRNSLAQWIEQLEAIQGKGRELTHLTATMRAGLFALEQAIEEGRE